MSMPTRIVALPGMDNDFGNYTANLSFLGTHYVRADTTDAVWTKALEDQILKLYEENDYYETYPGVCQLCGEGRAFEADDPRWKKNRVEHSPDCIVPRILAKRPAMPGVEE